MEETAKIILHQLRAKVGNKVPEMPTSPVLKVDILSARGLLLDPNYLHKLQLHVLFHGQIFRSQDIQGNDDPIFNFTANFDLKFDTLLSVQNLMKLNDPVVIYLTSTPQKVDEKNHVGLFSKRTLLAAAIVDFKYSFLYTGDYLSVELLPCEYDNMIATGSGNGVLFLRLSFDNLPPEEEFGNVQSKEVEEAITNFQTKINKDNREFYHLARSWWARTLRQYPYIEHRPIKVLAKDESGQHRFVSSFVSVISPPRELNGPRFAARFVSLIAYNRHTNSLLGATRADDCWRAPHALLSCLEGDVEEHAVLLCSLLLGYGMDAWVVQGAIQIPPSTSKKDSHGQPPSTSPSAIPHSWVVTFDSTDHPSPTKLGRNIRVTFWEALSGQQYEVESSTTTTVNNSGLASHPFSDIYALFRHDCYLLNLQQNTSLIPTFTSSSSSKGATGTSSSSSPYHHMKSDNTSEKILSFSFDLADERFWLPFPLPSGESTWTLAGSPSFCSLRHPGANIVRLTAGPSYDVAVTVEVQLEEYLKIGIAKWRAADLGLPTQYDDHLGTLLQPALIAYEWDRVVGISFGNTDFQSSVKRYVRKGEVFKAYPTCFSHINGEEAMQWLHRTVAARDVVLLGEGDARHAVRVKVFPYPEGLVAVWIMIAVCGLHSPASSNNR